jgi:hypothetical protein
MAAKQKILSVAAGIQAAVKKPKTKKARNSG